MNKKAIEEKIFLNLMRISSIFIVFIVILILTSIIWKGISAVNWSIISQTPKGGYYLGKEGGILNAIIGSFYLAGLATVLAFVIGLPIVFLMNIYLKKKSRISSIIRLSFDVLWGIPSIVYGAFGFTIMIFFGMKASLLAGIIIVSILVLPIIVRAIDEVAQTVPLGLINASLSLGATKLETGKIISRQILPGIITAVLIAFGRAIGDAASVLFTAGYSDEIPKSITDSVATLPLAIFFQLSSPIKEVQDRAFAAVLVLTVIVLVISLVSRLISNHFNKYKI